MVLSDQFCSGVSHLCLLPLTSPEGRHHCPACQRYSRTESALAFMCLGMEIGLPVTQNALGHLLGHVCDHGDDPKNPATRIYRTAERQLFHTDSCDVVRDASHIQCCSPVPRSCPCACVPRVLVARPWVRDASHIQCCSPVPRSCPCACVPRVLVARPWVRDASHIQCCSPVPRSCPCACVPRVLVARPWVLF
jgi:hypothetical protein